MVVDVKSKWGCNQKDPSEYRTKYGLKHCNMQMFIKSGYIWNITPQTK